jgi:DNA-binding HxlR family transcriptional regulator
MEPARATDIHRASDTPPRPALRAIAGGRSTEDASVADREMIEATNAALELFAGKWKVDILYLLAAGIRRHKHLHEHLLVSKKVLSDALKALERDGLVQRSVFADIPVRIEYSLTPLGRSLTGPLFTLYEWADKHLDHVAASRTDSEVGAAGRACDNRLPRFTAAFQLR